MCEAKLERVRALQEQLQSDTTRPMPERVETSAPGAISCLVHVHASAHEHKKNMLGHRFFAEADPGKHAPGNQQVPISFLCVIGCLHDNDPI